MGLYIMFESQQRNYFGFILWILSADDLVEAHGRPISLTKEVPTNGFAQWKHVQYVNLWSVFI